MESEVAKILEALPNHPLAIYWKAYLQRSNNNHATELLNKANSASTTLIFPFRTSLNTHFTMGCTKKQKLETKLLFSPALT